MTNDTPKRGYPIENAMLSENYGDLLTPGVVVELDPEDADSLGPFEESALSEADAWESNMDAEQPTDGE